MCCETSEKEDGSSMVVIIQTLKNEIDLLKKLIFEKDEKNRIQSENIQLLKQNNQLLKENLGTSQNKANKKAENSADKTHILATKTAEADKINLKSKNETQQKVNNIQGPCTSKDSKVNDQSSKQKDELLGYQKQIMDNLININDESTNNNDDGFIEVNNRKSRSKKDVSYKKKTFGLNKTENFGVEKKAWIYLYRIKRHVTEEKILGFLKNSPKFKDAGITVKELPTSDSQNKCFMLSADFNLKDELYDPNNWPQSVGIRRFDFKKYHSYQQRNKPADF
ncbi:unnamed protein product [Psylliodes chrysocephalus]|uniref:Uncharacterized protein n=1 Tax=Psylliodes chrysocephalus TaxID=3402493 RepID=A0A9P0CNX4_9CUCU|nr:unnamed protein product [Psylliodes chrysocephala]